MIGYEFPAASPGAEPSGGWDEQYDPNWLVVNVSGSDADGRAFSMETPCLLAWEAMEVAGWLHSVAMNDGTVRAGAVLEFIEQELTFACRAVTPHVVTLDVHVRPDPPTPTLPADGVTLPLDVAVPDLLRGAEERAQGLRHFPIRGGYEYADVTDGAPRHPAFVQP